MFLVLIIEFSVQIKTYLIDNMNEINCFARI